MLTTQQVEEKVAAIERQLLTPHGPSAVGWAGIWFAWSWGRKRDGCTLRRGKAYGHITYTDELGVDSDIGRLKAIETVLTPFKFRKEAADLKDIVQCRACPAVAFGPEARNHWEHVGWDRWDGIEMWDLQSGPLVRDRFSRHYFWLCADCLKALATGRMRRRLR